MKKWQNVFKPIGTITALAALLLVMLSTMAMAQQQGEALYITNFPD